MVTTPQWHMTIPAWVGEVIAKHPGPYTDDNQRMALAIALAAGNLAAGSGGPFGAAVFDTTSNALIAAAPNLVFASGASFAHAEMVALTLAQQALATPDLSAYSLTLYTSAQPCAMCLGALPWSGLSGVVCAARDADVRAVGFDEGSKPEHWPSTLEQRGITVVNDVCRAEAVAVLNDYQERQGRLY